MNILQIYFCINIAPSTLVAHLLISSSSLIKDSFAATGTLKIPPTSGCVAVWGGHWTQCWATGYQQTCARQDGQIKATQIRMSHAFYPSPFSFLSAWNTAVMPRDASASLQTGWRRPYHNKSEGLSLMDVLELALHRVFPYTSYLININLF